MYSYLFDNTYFHATDVEAKLKNFKAGLGLISASVDYQESKISHSISGFAPIADKRISAGCSYFLTIGAFEATPTYQQVWYPTGKSGRMRFSGSLPLSFTLPAAPAVRWSPHVRFDYGVTAENPFAQYIGVTKRSIGADVAAQVAQWEFHCDYQNDQYKSVDRKDLNTILNDTLFFKTFFDVVNPLRNFIDDATNPLPENTLHNFSFYTFGPITPVLYGGLSIAYRTTQENFYLPLAETDSGEILYGYAPYTTPQDEWSAHCILAFEKKWASNEALINNLFSKITMPLVSGGTYRGYYQSVPKNILAGFGDFYYFYNGLAPLTFTASMAKNLWWNTSLGVEYKIYSQPYSAYSFFGKNSYTYHTIDMSITKKF